MEADKNIMPEFNLGIVEHIKDVAQRVGHFLLSTEQVHYSASDHCPDHLLGKVVGE
jgi:hypothetical protein